MITSQELQLLRAGIDEVFMEQFNRPTRYERIFNVGTSEKEYEEFLQIAGFPALVEWNADGGELPVAKPIQGGKTVLVHKDYGLFWTVSKRLMRGDQYRIVSSQLTRDAGRAAQTTAELIAHIVLNMATNASYPLWDGQPLLSTAHPLLGGGSQSNRLSSVLSYNALRDALTLFRKTRNHRGHPVWIEPRYLVVSPTLEVTAKELLNSTTYGIVEPIGGSNANLYTGQRANPFNGLVELIVDPYLNDNYWFLMAEPRDHRLYFFWREKPKPVTEIDFRTQGVSTAITMACVAGAVDYIGVVGYAG